MSEVVSLKTAKRLKAAGFPQGGWKEGIAIYAPTGDKYLIGEDVGSGYSIVDGWTVCSPSSIEGTDIFAPSVIDILKELSEYYSLWYVKPIWYCTEDFVPTKDALWKHKKPAEACAAAWLSIHEKKQ